MATISFPQLTDEEFSQMAEQIIHENHLTIPTEMDLCMEDFLKIVLETFSQFFDEFPDEGYMPLIGFTDAGESIQNQSRVQAVRDEQGVPFLYVQVFQDNGAWIFSGHLDFDHFLGYFAGTALQFLTSAKRSQAEMSDDEFKKLLIGYTLQIMDMAMRRLPKWIELMVGSFETKMGLIWSKYLYKEIREEHSFRGVDFPTIDFNLFRQRFVRETVTKIRDFMNDDNGFERHLLKLKKKNLAVIYKTTYDHWESMHSLQLKGMNWRRYVQSGDMTDITDDLVEEFERDVAIGDIAIEHAARRVELLNTIRLASKTLELRSRGIKCSGYSRSKLFQFKREGEELLREEQSSAKTAGVD